MVPVLSNFFFIATSLFPEFIDVVCSGIIWRNKIFPGVGRCWRLYTPRPSREKDRFKEAEAESARRDPSSPIRLRRAGLFSFCAGVFIIYTNSSKALMRECMIQRLESIGTASQKCLCKQTARY
jgi:hypothetical protein